MQTYSYAKLVVNGKDTDTLDIFRDGNRFAIYDYEQCIYDGFSAREVITIIDAWKKRHSSLVEYLQNNGWEVHFEQTLL